MLLLCRRCHHHRHRHHFQHQVITMIGIFQLLFYQHYKVVIATSSEVRMMRTIGTSSSSSSSSNTRRQVGSTLMTILKNPINKNNNMLMKNQSSHSISQKSSYCNRASYLPIKTLTRSSTRQKTRMAFCSSSCSLTNSRRYDRQLLHRSLSSATITTTSLSLFALQSITPTHNIQTSSSTSSTSLSLFSKSSKLQGDTNHYQQQRQSHHYCRPRSHVMTATMTRNSSNRRMNSSNIDHDNINSKNNKKNKKNIRSTNHYYWEDTNAIISSTKSKTIKHIKGLLTKRKQRIEHQQTIVEGSKMVFELLTNPSSRSLIRQVLISTSEYEQRIDEYISVLSFLNEDDENSSSEYNNNNNLMVHLVTPQVFQTACSDTVTPQGIVAVVDIPSSNNAMMNNDDDKTIHSTSSSSSLVLVLDGVSDPGNVGTLIRSSVAVGVKAILLLPGCCDVWNPKAIRSAMGASFYVPIIKEVSNYSNLIIQLQSEWNINHLYAATMLEATEEEEDDSKTNSDNNNNGKISQPYFDIDWLTYPTALIIGSEGQGLSTEIRTALLSSNDDDDDDILQAVHVPMENSAGVESLNAAVCGSIIMFEYYRQCQLVPSKNDKV